MKAVFAGTIIVSALASSALPADQSPLKGLFGCLDLADADKRASCLEGEARRLQDGERRRDVVVMDRGEVEAFHQQTAKRPAAEKKERAAFTPVDAPLTGAQVIGGRWLFTTEKSGVWIQAEASELGRTPRAGDRFRVRRGVIGGYLANIGTGPAIRVRSVQ